MMPEQDNLIPESDPLETSSDADNSEEIPSENSVDNNAIDTDLDNDREDANTSEATLKLHLNDEGEPYLIPAIPQGIDKKRRTETTVKLHLNDENDPYLKPDIPNDVSAEDEPDVDKKRRTETTVKLHLNDEDEPYLISAIPQNTDDETSSEIRPDTSEDEQTYRDIEDLSISELIGQWMVQPLATWRVFSKVLRADRQTETVSSESLQIEVRENDKPPAPLRILLAIIGLVMGAPADDMLDSENKQENPPASLWRRIFRAYSAPKNRLRVQLSLFIFAFVLAWVGSGTLLNTPSRTEESALSVGFPLLFAGFLVWLFAELVGNWAGLQHWWDTQSRSERTVFFLRLIPLTLILTGIYILVRSTDEPPEIVLTLIAPGVQFFVGGAVLWFLLDMVTGFAGHDRKRKDSADELYPDSAIAIEDISPNIEWYRKIHPSRPILLFTGLLLGAALWVTLDNYNNTMPGLSWVTWLASIACVALAFAPLDFNPVQWAQGWRMRLQTINLRSIWLPVVLFVAIMMLAGFFRLDKLTGANAIPPEMTSDHVEKILDSNRVLNGNRNIFFSNNGGREPFQMYAMAVFSQLPGQGMNHDSLKLLAVLESLITIPILFWLGYEVVGRDNRRLGLLVGLVMAGLVAASYWHTSITRLALRIVLTPLITSLMLIYLSRALRSSNRADFIKAGLVLGFGLYTYQAVRMLPIVILVAVGIAIYFAAKSWQHRLRYTVNLSVLVLVAFMVFVPLFNFSVQNPDDFWRRTAGRLLGDDLITETLPDGTIIERDASLEERLDAFNQNLPTLMDNVRNALLMFNWKGDVAWINGFPNHPAMDPVTGSLFFIGLAAWLSLMIRRRDVVIWLIPVVLLIMLLPSALSIAFPIENPSFTRTSGALPSAYMIAALPLALILERFLILMPSVRGKVIGIIFSGMLILGAYAANASVYFDPFVRSYEKSSLPYSDAGRVLQGFTLSTGSYGNAFMIAYPYWWDHRAVGIAGGAVDWVNGIVTLDNVPEFLRLASEKSSGDPYHLDVSRDLLFFFSPEDIQTKAQLEAWFPTGYARLELSYQIGDD
ncbi:MAG: hypothetical protein ACPG7F_11340, partial [Aggregatilineales bacterium]